MSRATPIRPLAGLLLFALGAACWLGLAAGSPPICRAWQPGSPRETESETLPYSLEQVRRQQLTELATDCLPLRRDEFQKLLESARGQAAAPVVAAGARLTNAQYAARVEGADLVDGSAVLTVHCAAESPSMLALSPCSLAIRQASWRDSKAQRVVLGVDSGDNLLALVSKSDNLQLQWSQRGKGGPAGETVFHLQLPPCPQNLLTLDVPRGLLPVLDHGIVSRAADAGASEETTAEASRTARWNLQLGGNTSVQLMIEAEGARPSEQRLVLLRQAMTYNFSSRGLLIQADLRLDVHNEPLRQLTLSLDDELRIISVRDDRQNLRWTPASPEKNGRQRITVELLQPFLGTDQILRLSAMAPLKTGTGWRLPHLLAENVVWREGTASLDIPAPLELRELTPIRCRQAKVTGLASPDKGEHYELQYYAPDAEIDVIVGRQEGALQVDSGASIQIDEKNAVARVIADLSTRAGGAFATTVEVSRSWRMSGVQCEPANALEDWNLSPDRGRQPRLLRLSFKRAVSSDAKRRIIITLQRNSPGVDAAFGSDFFRVVRFPDADQEQRLVSINVAPSFRLETADGQGLRLLAEDGLGNEQKERVAARPGGIVFWDDGDADFFKIYLRRDPARFHADIEIDTVAGPAPEEGLAWVTQEITVNCRPESTLVTRLLIQFPQDIVGPIDWSILGEAGPSLASRRLGSDERLAAGLPEGDYQEVALRRPRSDPFSLRGARRDTWREKLIVPLVALPSAATQTGVLRVGTSGGMSLNIVNNGLKSIPAEATAPSEATVHRAVYRYNPTSDETVVLTAKASNQTIARCVVWSAELSSRFYADGRTQHELRCRMENSGADRLRISLPRNSQLLEVFLNEKSLANAGLGNTDASLSIPLPENVRYPTLRVLYASRREALRTSGRLSTEFPSVSAAVIQRRWRAGLPPEYAHAARRESQSGWVERLFAAVRPHDAPGPFNLVDGAQWRSLFGPAEEDTRRGRAADRFLQWLGSASQETTWNRLLRQYQETVDAAQDPDWFPLVIDRGALAELGVTPQQNLASNDPSDAPSQDSVPNSPQLEQAALGPASFQDVSGGPAQMKLVKSGLARLGQSNLALLVGDRRMLLTSMSQFSENAEKRVPADLPQVALLGPGRQREHIDQTTAEAEGYVDVSRWARHPAGEFTPWRFENQPAFDGVGDRGWTSYVIEAPANHHPGGAFDVVSTDYYQPRQTVGLAWIAALLTVLGAWSVGRYVPGLAPALFVVSAWLALLLPVALATVASGVFVGTTTSLILFLLWPALHQWRRPQPSLGNASGPYTQEAALTVLLLGVLLPASRLPGQQSDANQPAGSETVYRVFSPVTENGDPDGDYVFIPRAYYVKLNERIQSVGGATRGVLATRIVYRGSLEWDNGGANLKLRDLAALIDVEAFETGQTLQLPYAREAVEIVSARLDGQAVPTNEDPEKKLLSLSVPVGEHRLELLLRPRVAEAEELASVAFDVFPAAMAQLRINLPPDVSGVEFPDALGFTSRDEATGAYLVDMGSTSKFSIRWPASRRASAGERSTDVEQLMWLKVRPSSVVVDVRWKFSRPAASLRRIRLYVDPRLRLLPIRADQQVASQSIQTTEGVKTIDLELAAPFEQELRLETSFLLAGSSGVGNIRMPRLDAGPNQATRRWLGVTVSPTLEYDANEEQEVFSLSVADFAAAWGAADPPPQRAFRIPGGQPVWTLATRPRRPRTSAEELLQVGVRHDQLRLVYQAALDTTDGAVFQHRLLAPSNFRVDEVSVLQQQQSRLLRWSRIDANHIAVLLNGPVTGQHVLKVAGRIPSRRKRLEIPKIWLEEVEPRSGVIRIYRGPHVSLRLASLAGLAPMAVEEGGDYDDVLGRQTAALRMEHNKTTWEQVKAELAVTPNKPAFQSRIVTRLERDHDAWMVDLEYRMLVTSGEVDSLRLDIPQEWVGPFTFESVLSHRIEQAPAANRRRLVLLLQNSTDREQTIRLRGRLATAARERVSSPEIIPLDTKDPERYLLLPRRLDRQEIAWEPNRWLDPVEIPSDLAAPVPEEAFQAYRATRLGARATIREQVSGVPQVRLAEIRISWTPDLACYGLACFDLDPAGLSYCVLQLPPSFELLQIRVATLAGFAKSLGENRWRIAVGPENLPQRIEVFFRGQLPDSASANRRLIPAPVLVDLQVERTLWTVRGPESAGAGNVTAGASQISGLRLDQLRLQTTASFLSIASEIVAQNAHQETADWYTPWARRIMSARRRVLERLGETDREASGEIAMIDEEQGYIAERLGTEQILARVAAEIPFPVDANGWQGPPWQAGPAAYATELGSSDSLELEYDRGASTRIGVRLLMGLLLTLCGCLAFVGFRFPTVIRWLQRRPQLTFTAAALSWWAWGFPSVLGPLLLLLGAAWLISTARKRRRPRPASSLTQMVEG